MAATVYGAVIDDEGKVKVAESQDLRKKMRNKCRERSVDTKEWWKKEREQVLRKAFSEDVYNMYADCLKYSKFRSDFTAMWQVPADYKL